MTGRRTQPKLIQLIGQIGDKRQGEKGPVSEAPGPLSFRFVAARGSGQIVKIVGPGHGAWLLEPFLYRLRKILALQLKRYEWIPFIEES